MTEAQRTGLLGALTDAQFNELIAGSQQFEFLENDYLIKAGQASSEIYIITSGRVAVEVPDASGELHVVSVLGQDEVVGEMALLDAGTRSASVRALEPVSVRAIAIDTGSGSADLRLQLSLNLGRMVSQRLKSASDTQVAAIKAHLQESRQRAEMGHFLGKMLICTFLYTITLCALKGLSELVPATTFVTIPILALFGGVMFYIIKSSSYPLAEYGLTTRGAGAAVREALLFSLPVLALVVMIKQLLIWYAPSMQGMDLFGLSVIRFTHDPEITFGLTVAVIGGYLMFSPIQEFIVRCGMQSSFQKFFEGRHARTLSIVLATMLFSSTHLHVSFILATIVFPLGLFWGWLYSRHPTLIGVSVSHMLIGFFGLFIVEFPTTD